MDVILNERMYFCLLLRAAILNYVLNCWLVCKILRLYMLYQFMEIIVRTKSCYRRNNFCRLVMKSVYLLFLAKARLPRLLLMLVHYACQLSVHTFLFEHVFVVNCVTFWMNFIVMINEFTHA